MTETNTSAETTAVVSKKRTLAASLVAGVVGIVIAGIASQLVDKAQEKITASMTRPRPTTESE